MSDLSGTTSERTAESSAATVRLLTLAVVAYGALGLALQVFLLRTLLGTFGGNELAVVLGLVIWLLSVGAGSWLHGRFCGGPSRALKVLGVCFWLLSSLPVGCMLLLPAAIGILEPSSGEVFGPLEVVAYSTVVLALPCLLWGAGFTAFCVLGECYRLRPARVFFLESLGAAVGGGVYTFVLLPLLSEWALALLLGGFVLSLWIYLTLIVPGKRSNWVWILVCCEIILLLGCGFFGDRLTRWTTETRWSGMKFIERTDTIYGSIIVMEREGQISFFESGRLAFSFPDAESIEDIIHLPLLQHRNPKRVLLIGGGPSALLEVCKHPIDAIHYVELDPALVQLGRRYILSQSKGLSEDKRVRFLFGDARRFVKTTEWKYDVVISCLGDPTTTQLNRFYTLEFMKEVENVLGPEGIVAFEISSAENFIAADLARYLRVLRNTLQSVYAQTAIIPGIKNQYMGSKASREFILDADEIGARLEQRGVDAEFLLYYHLPVRLDSFRLDELDSTLNNASTSLTNRDHYPISFYMSLLLWSKEKTVTLGRFLYSLLEHRVAFFACFSLGVIALTLCMKFRFRSVSRVICQTAFIGFAEMGLTVLLILGFNSVLGYVYHRLALLTAAFMFGTGLGAWFRSGMRGGKLGAKILRRNGLCLAVVLGAYPFLFSLGQMPTILLEFVFYALSFAAGCIGGQTFPLCYAIVQDPERVTSARVAGLLYGADLLGSSLGACLVSLIFVPLGGVWTSALLMAVMIALAVA